MPISACLIARNEASNIRRCLESIIPYCEEIIVVDTGSTDQTAEIARACGAVVYPFVWTNDFSAARNFSLSKAHHPWILMIDCDEILCPLSHDTLDALLLDERVLGYGLTLSNIVQGAETYATVSPRLFRNLPYIRFKGVIHENLEDTRTHQIPNGPFLKSSLKLLHYGYDLDPALEQAKISRNLFLLLSVPDAEKDALYYLHLGSEYVRLQDFDLASFYFKKGIALATPDLPCYKLLVHRLADALFQNKAYTEAVAFMESMLLEYPDFKCLHFLKALCHVSLGDYPLAKTHLAIYKDLPHLPFKYPAIMYESTMDLDALSLSIENACTK